MRLKHHFAVASGWPLETALMILFIGAEAGYAIGVEAGMVSFAQGRRVQRRRLVDHPGRRMARGNRQGRGRGRGGALISHIAVVV